MAADPTQPVTGLGFGAGSNGAWDWDIVRDQVHVDAAFADLYGLEPTEASGPLPASVFFKAIHPADRARIRIAIAGILAGTEVFTKEFRIVRADGSVVWVQGRGQTHFDATDQPVRFAGVLVDVTDRKRAEERLRIAQSAGGIGTFEFIDGFATVSVSAEFCRLLGLHPTTVLPVRTINAVLAPGDAALIPETAPLPDQMEADFRIIRRDTQESCWIARRGEVIHDQGGSGFRLVGVIYDVTKTKRQEAELRQWAETLEARVDQEMAERRQAEDALRQAQKMEAVGHLTGGLAHDFNNLLSGISGSLEMMRTRITQGRLADVERYMVAALGATQRAASLTHRLLAFSRRQTLTPVSTDVNKLVHGMEELVRRTVGPSIEVETVGAAGLWRTLVDPSQLENALLNLCINARDAMPGGGKLTIETSNGWMDERAAASRDLPSGQYIKLCVSDTGTGMPKEVIEKAFDPFFTTKPIGHGTGLGLSMVYGFARQSGGQVRIYSEVGHGTMVCIYLPRHVGQAIETDDTVMESQAEGAVLGETVLVVDDEPTVRMLVIDALEDLGYATLEARDAQSGLKVLQSDQRVDLLVTDVGLPGGMNGRQLAEAARTLRPGCKVLFITGYAENAVLNHGHLEHGMEVLTKPFSIDTLAHRIRSIINTARG